MPEKLIFNDSQIKMKGFYLLLFMLISAGFSYAQEWSEPVNVSNMEGKDKHLDFIIDHNGIIHCVWAHQHSSSLFKVYYSKSEDQGTTWTEAEDVSQNTSLRCDRPHIVANSQNVLFVSYDYDSYSTTQSLIGMKTFDGVGWSQMDTVSVGMPGSFRNTINIDNNDRVYCFWYFGTNSGYFSYRYYENETWSETLSPYNNVYHMLIQETVIDADNKVHCLGNMFNEWSYDEAATYFYYEPITDQWSGVDTMNSKSYSMDAGIDLDGQNNPHIVWRQNRYLSGPNNDSTMYTYFNGNAYSEPELIVEDPFNQRCQVLNNKVYIMNLEKDGDLNNVVMYEKDNSGNWIGEVLISAEVIAHISLFSKDAKHHLFLHGKIDNNEYEIYYMNKVIDTATNINEPPKFSINGLKIYPNPFSESTHVFFNVLMPGVADVSVYELSGRRIATLTRNYKIPGEQQVTWGGKDDEGNQVNNGLYLVRLRHGNNILTRSVEYIR